LCLQKALTGVSIFFVAASTLDRSRIASQFQIAPEKRSFASNRIGVDNLMREWMATITIPSIFVGGVVNAAAAAVKANPQLFAGAMATRVPAAVGLASVPLLLPLSYMGSDFVMNWAIRPFLNAYMRPGFDLPWAAAAPPGPTPEYTTPNPEDLLSADAQDIASLLAGDLDPLQRARVAWALDGNVTSPFPESSSQNNKQDRTTTQRVPINAKPETAALAPSSGAAATAEKVVEARSPLTPVNDEEYIREVHENFLRLQGNASKAQHVASKDALR
jgi:hypothetical protein